MESSVNREIMACRNPALTLQFARRPVEGIRQHFLKYNNPLTPRIHEKAGLLYDATLGFAEQIGFRNSYAGPFQAI